MRSFDRLIYCILNPREKLNKTWYIWNSSTNLIVFLFSNQCSNWLKFKFWKRKGKKYKKKIKKKNDGKKDCFFIKGGKMKITKNSKTMLSPVLILNDLGRSKVRINKTNSFQVSNLFIVNRGQSKFDNNRLVGNQSTNQSNLTVNFKRFIFYNLQDKEWRVDYSLVNENSWVNFVLVK